MQNMPRDTAAAEAYEKYLVPAFLGPWARRIVGIARPQPGEIVLDLACGTGAGARVVAETIGSEGRIVGVDWDPSMIAVATTLSRQWAVPNEWHCASAMSLPLPSASFDLCLCLQGLQFFQDRKGALGEVRRVLKARGRLVGSMWTALEDVPAYDALVRALERQHIDTGAIRTGFSFGDPEKIGDAALQVGFDSVEVKTEHGYGSCASVSEFVEIIAAGSTRARQALAALSPAGRRQLQQEMSEMLSAYVTDGLKWPMKARVLVAHTM